MSELKDNGAAATVDAAPVINCATIYDLYERLATIMADIVEHPNCPKEIRALLCNVPDQLWYDSDDYVPATGDYIRTNLAWLLSQFTKAQEREEQETVQREIDATEKWRARTVEFLEEGDPQASIVASIMFLEKRGFAVTTPEPLGAVPDEHWSE